MGKKINIDDAVGNWGLSIIHLLVDFLGSMLWKDENYVYRAHAIERWEFNALCHKINTWEEMTLSVQLNILQFYFCCMAYNTKKYFSSRSNSIFHFFWY